MHFIKHLCTNNPLLYRKTAPGFHVFFFFLFISSIKVMFFQFRGKECEVGKKRQIVKKTPKYQHILRLKMNILKCFQNENVVKLVLLLLFALVSSELLLLLASDYSNLKHFLFCVLPTCILFAYRYTSSIICFRFSLLESDTLAKVNTSSSFVSAVLYYYYTFSSLEKCNAKTIYNGTLRYVFLDVSLATEWG